MRSDKVLIARGYRCSSVRGPHKNRSGKAILRRAAKKIHRNYIAKILRQLHDDIAVVLA